MGWTRVDRAALQDASNGSRKAGGMRVTWILTRCVSSLRFLFEGVLLEATEVEALSWHPPPSFPSKVGLSPLGQLDPNSLPDFFFLFETESLLCHPGWNAMV